MDRVTIDDHEHGLGGIDHQAAEEFLEDRGGHRSVVDHETEIAARAYRGDHVERKATAGVGDDRRFANRRHVVPVW